MGLQQYARLRDANPFASQWVPGKEFFLESGARPLSKDDWMAVQALFEAAKSTFVIKANADLGQPMPALHVVEVNAEGREVPGKQPRNPTRAELIGLHETVACKLIAKLVVLSRAPDATPANVVRGWLQSLNERDVSLFRWPTLKVKKEAVAIQQRRFARAGGEEETYRTDEPVKAPRLYFSFPLALRYLLNAAESVLGRRMPKFLEGGYSLIGTTLMLGGADRVLLEFVGRIMDFEADPTKPRWAVHRAIYGDDSLAVILERSEDGPTRATLVAADFSRMDLRVPTNMFWLIFLRANQLLPLTGAEQVALRLWAFWLQGPTGVVWEDSIFNHQGGFRSGISGIAYANSFVTEHLYEILETFLERGAPALTAWRQAKEFMKDHLGCVVEDEVPPISLEVDGNFDPDGPLMTAFTQMPLLGGHFRLHRGAGGDVNFVHLIKEERLLKHLVCPTGPKTVRPERIIGIALSGLFYEHYDSLRKLYQRFYVTKEEVGTLADEDDAAMFGALLSPEGTLPHEFPTWERFLEVHLVPRAPPAPPRSEVGVKPDFELVVPPSFNVISGVRRRVKTVRT